MNIDRIVRIHDVESERVTPVGGTGQAPHPTGAINRAPTPSLRSAFWATPVAILLILITTAFNIQQDAAYYNTMTANSTNASNQLQLRVAADLRRAITPDQLVVTDAQFIAGLAQRRTPSTLVDTSTVRITDGSLTLQQLIEETSQPQVHAALFFTARFYLPNVAGFHAWVAQHFHLLHTYGPGQELWVR